MFKIVLLFLGGWGIPLFASLVLTALTAGLTSRWSASRVGPVMLMLLAVELLLFLGGSVFLWRRLAGALEPLPRALTVVAHLAVQLLTYGILVLTTFVAFNR
jgi:cytochrome bd-type quinol oxidase subunit 2